MDRISHLPDDVLQYILSFLWTQEAAKTSLLSRRWRYLWAYAPALAFDNLDRFDHMTERKICSTMINHKPSTLRRLQISATYYTRNESSSSRYVLRKEFLDELLQGTLSTGKSQVRELQLKMSHDHHGYKRYRLPRDIFSSGNLRILKLVGCYIGRDVGIVKLSGIETLSLKNVHSSVEAFNNLISSCCNVKNLELALFDPVVADLSISLLELRKLVLEHDYLINFTMDAPKLQYVKLAVPTECLKFSMPSSCNLMYADVEVCDGNDIQIRNLVHEFGQSKIFKLRIDRGLPLDFFERCPPCCNVKKLAVDVGFHLTSALSFLKLIPNLEDLTLAYSVCDDGTWIEEDEGVEDLQHVSLYCLKYCLRRIKIENFRCRKDQVKLAKFLAENALVLETMNLTKCFGYLNSLLEIKNNLVMRKASKFAQITCI